LEKLLECEQVGQMELNLALQRVVGRAIQMDTLKATSTVVYWVVVMELN